MSFNLFIPHNEICYGDLPHKNKMYNRFNKKDLNLLKLFLDYRIVSVPQISMLSFPSRQMARRKIRDLVKAGLVQISARGYGITAGRPENLISLTDKGIKLLEDHEISMPGSLEDRKITIEPSQVEHQLLLNWVRINIRKVGERIPQINIRFLSPVFDHQDYVFKKEDTDFENGFIPDGIFSISHNQQNKTLLFFLEIDMGTETLSSKNPIATDISKKVIGYQSIFSNQSYNQLNGPLNSKFHGFRVLFISNTETRLRQLCKLVKSMKSTGFIWLTDKNSVFENGISDKIWIKGGDIDKECYSILGPSLATKTPIDIAN